MTTRRNVVAGLAACGSGAVRSRVRRRLPIRAGRSASSYRSRRVAAPISCRDFIQPHMQSLLGQSVIVENRAGAAGRIGTGIVAKSEPDGHTLLVSTESSLVIAPHIGQSIGYDPLKDFAPVSLLTRNTVMLVVHPSVPANTLQEFMALARAKPGRAVLCLVGRRRPQSSGRRDFQPHDRAADHACAIPGHGAGAAGGDFQSGWCDVGLHGGPHPAHPRGIAPRAGGRRHGALARAAGCANGGGSGCAGLRGGVVDWHGGTVRLAGAGDGQALGRGAHGDAGQGSGRQSRSAAGPRSWRASPRSSAR